MRSDRGCWTQTHTTHNTPTPTTPPGPAGTDLNILSVSSDTQVEVTPVLRGSTYSQSQGLTAAVNKHGVRGGLLLHLLKKEEKKK